MIDFGAGAAGVHVAGLSQERIVKIERDILGKNNGYAAENRARLARTGTFALNFVSSPGSGKTSLLSGSIGDHGVAVMSKRENLSFETQVLSDTAALHDLVAIMVEAAGASIRLMRDPTRGGLAATLNEIAHQSRVGVRIEEAAVPVRPQVAAACELLGLDPLFVANEGKLVAFVAPEAAEKLLATMRAHPLGQDSARIGEVIEDDHCFVRMTTAFGGGRIVDWLIRRAIAANLLSGRGGERGNLTEAA